MPGMSLGYLAYPYMLRVPLVVAAATALLAWAAWSPKAPGHALAHGIFDVSPWGLAVVALLATFLALSLTAVSELVLRYGPARFLIPPLPPSWLTVVLEVGVVALRAATAVLLGVYLSVAGFVIASAVRNGHGTGLGQGLGIAAGVSAALALLFGGLRLWPTAPALLRSFMGWVARWAGEGYVGKLGEALPGHGTATLCLGIFGILFLVFGLDLVRPPTLVSVLTFFVAVVLTLSGAAFLFDGFRFPFFVAIALLFWLTAQFQHTDQYFAAHKITPPPPALSPREVLEAGLRHDPDRAVIVCAVGGGIQAGAWAARVLQGLEELTGGELSPRVRLVSSVSGGSYGTLYYTASFDDGRLRAPEKVVASAMASSLDRVAFGLVYRDFLRTVAPLFVGRLSGRGPEAERAWSDRERHPAAPAPEARLAGWREDARAARRPAHIFNAMVAETGERFLMSTVDLGPDRAVGRLELAEFYPDLDLAPVTAARMSSAFPYVGAAARVDAEVKQAPHLVDGGYYDNYGVTSAIDFLLDATDPGGGDSPVKRVLLIDISGYEDGSADTRARLLPPTQRGWFYQTFAPIQALLSMRSTAQKSRNEVDLAMLGEVLRARGVELTRATFAFPEAGEPLSWHLTAGEQTQIGDAWGSPGLDRARETVVRFLE